jgi:hypothetical protein
VNRAGRKTATYRGGVGWEVLRESGHKVPFPDGIGLIQCLVVDGEAQVIDAQLHLAVIHCNLCMPGNHSEHAVYNIDLAVYS